MNIKAIFMYPENGYEHQRIFAKKRGLIVGQSYDLEGASVGRYSSIVLLKGIDGSFNSVQFEFKDNSGNDVNIYVIPEFQEYGI